MNVAWIKYDPPGPFYIPPLVWGSKFCTCPRGHIGGPSAPQETYEWTTVAYLAYDVSEVYRMHAISVVEQEAFGFSSCPRGQTVEDTGKER